MYIEHSYSLWKQACIALMSEIQWSGAHWPLADLSDVFLLLAYSMEDWFLNPLWIVIICATIVLKHHSPQMMIFKDAVCHIHSSFRLEQASEWRASAQAALVPTHTDQVSLILFYFSFLAGRSPVRELLPHWLSPLCYQCCMLLREEILWC